MLASHRDKARGEERKKEGIGKGVFYPSPGERSSDLRTPFPFPQSAPENPNPDTWTFYLIFSIQGVDRNRSRNCEIYIERERGG